MLCRHLNRRPATFAEMSDLAAESRLMGRLNLSLGARIPFNITANISWQPGDKQK
jgi:hypothetical protein